MYMYVPTTVVAQAQHSKFKDSQTDCGLTALTAQITLICTCNIVGIVRIAL
jgi:hypothetical protein